MTVFRRDTTPAISLRVNADLTEWAVYVAIKNGRNVVTIDGDRLTMRYANGKTAIEFSLTQEETLALSTGSSSVQVRAVNAHGIAVATDIERIPIDRIIKEGVISYE